MVDNFKDIMVGRDDERHLVHGDSFGIFSDYDFEDFCMVPTADIEEDFDAETQAYLDALDVRDTLRKYRGSSEEVYDSEAGLTEPAD